jgi:TRAP-type uncharacterized transport system substrate-binding protein
MYRAVAFVLLLVASACARDATRHLSIATGGTGGVYYPYGGTLARLLTTHLPGVNATAEVTGASVDNQKLLQLGRVDLAFTLAGMIESLYRSLPYSSSRRPTPSS